MIPRADKYALALMEFNKPPSLIINFVARVKSGPGTNITSVLINLNFTAPYMMSYAYSLAVVGHQPENTWIDIVHGKLPEDPA